MTIIFLGLGSNIGDREKHLTDAIAHLQPEILAVQISSIFETQPVGYLHQRDFLNIVLQGRTDLEIYELLEKAKSIEHQLGHETTVRYGPRSIDIDILLFENKTFESPDLIIPHPRMLERAFVMIPLAEIDPLLEIPGTSKTAEQIARTWEKTNKVRWYQPPPKTTPN
jgi:2-amino-4-hydroxy-6-hydroxymethyldihydropteridine diphosphokinase